MYAAFLSIIFTFVLYIPRKLITFRAFMKEMKEGMKSMIDTLIILVLAWTIGGENMLVTLLPRVLYHSGLFL